MATQLTDLMNLMNFADLCDIELSNVESLCCHCEVGLALLLSVGAIWRCLFNRL